MKRILIELVIFVGLVSGVIFVPDYPASIMPAEPLSVLRTADHATLYSIQPLLEEFKGPEYVDKSALFYGHKILGKTQLEGPKLSKVLSSIQHSILSNLFSDPEKFHPRYGLRIIKQGSTYDFVISFQYIQMDVYKDEAQIAHVHVWGGSSALNQILTEANIPLEKNQE